MRYTGNSVLPENALRGLGVGVHERRSPLLEKEVEKVSTVTEALVIILEPPTVVGQTAIWRDGVGEFSEKGFEFVTLEISRAIRHRRNVGIV